MRILKKTLAVMALSVIAVSAFAQQVPFRTTSITDTNQPSFYFTKDGVADAVIVVEKDVKKGYHYAADQLAKYLGKITGTSFLVAYKPVPGYKTILVGTPYKAKSSQETCIRFKDKDTLEITGDGALGTLYAVYNLLEDIGIVFCTVDFDYVPSNPNLSIPLDYSRVDAPVFKAREGRSALSTFNGMDFRMKLRMSATGSGAPGEANFWKEMGTPETMYFNHSLTLSWVKTKQFYDEKPEWFALNKTTGKRVRNALCMTNEEVIQQLIKEVGEALKANPNTKHISISMADCAPVCECDNCTAMTKTDDVPIINTSILNINIANRVAKHYAKQYPDVQFNVLCYGITRLAPVSKKFKLEPNVSVAIAIHWRNHGRPTTDWELSNQMFDRWVDLLAPNAKFYVWGYLANFRGYIQPFPNLDIIQPNIRYYRDKGAYGVRTQMQLCGYGDLVELHHYIHAKLLWNPDWEWRELTAHYLKAAYGPAAGNIQEYIDLLIHGKNRNRSSWIGDYVANSTHFLTNEDCLRIVELFDSAASKFRSAKSEQLRGQKLMLRRARLTMLSMALMRYNDLLAANEARKASKRRPHKLASREEYLNQWRSIIHGFESENVRQMIAENPGTVSKYEKQRFEEYFKVEPKPTFYPRKNSVVHISPAQMTGGSTMRIEKDKEGFDYARVTVDLSTTRFDKAFMVPSHAEVGYTIPADMAGEWYIFATVRVGATVNEPASAYCGVYSPNFVNDIVYPGQCEINSHGIDGIVGDESWRTVSFGKVRLIGGARVWVMPGAANPIKFQDVKEFIFVEPKLMESSVKLQ